MRRREFITLIGGTVAWPLAARGQQPNQMRRIGVLMTGPPDDQEGQSRLAGFLRGLQELGWTAGGNLQIDYRWANDSAHRHQYTAELIALAPAHSITSSARVMSDCGRSRPIARAALRLIDSVNLAGS